MYTNICMYAYMRTSYGIQMMRTQSQLHLLAAAHEDELQRVRVRAEEEADETLRATEQRQEEEIRAIDAIHQQQLVAADAERQTLLVCPHHMSFIILIIFLLFLSIFCKYSSFLNSFVSSLNSSIHTFSILLPPFCRSMHRSTTRHALLFCCLLFGHQKTCF